MKPGACRTIHAGPSRPLRLSLQPQGRPSGGRLRRPSSTGSATTGCRIPSYILHTANLTDGIELGMSASSPAGLPATANFINPETMHRPTGYTHVVEVTAGRPVYIAGQVALDPTGTLVGPGDIRAQARQVFDNLQAALQVVGASFEQVVKLNYYLVDATQLPAVREVRDEYVNTQQPPASTAVEVRRLFREDLLIEIEAVAVIGSSSL
jgi:enamine deaminase RidA (YjgF/YER057c/UK114 family)